MPRELFSSFFGNDTESEALPQGELWLTMSETNSLEQQVEQIFQTLRLPVYRYLLSVFGEPAEAEDLTQESFFRLYKMLLQGKEIKNIRFWVFRVAHNLAIDRKRHQQFVSALQVEKWEEAEKIISNGSLNPEQIVLQREKFERLFNGLKRLTLNERQCLYLRAEGFRYKEIAEIMNIGVPTVGEYLRRSIKKLGGNGGE